MNDYDIASIVAHIEEAIKAFNFFHNMGDHVMYRAHADSIYFAAVQLRAEVNAEDDDDQ